MSTGRLPDRKKDIAPKYPHNQVTVFPGGHEVHYDSTPGKERIRFAHKSGTYTEIYAQGDQTELVVGNSQQVFKGGLTLSVNDNGDIQIGGHARILIGGGAHLEVAGHAGIAVGGDVALVAGGNLKFNVQDIGIRARGNLDINVAKNTTIQTHGNFTQMTGGNSTIQAKGSSELAAAGAVKIDASGVTYIRGSQIRNQSGGHGAPPSFSFPRV